MRLSSISSSISSSGVSMEQVAAHVAQELMEMKTQSSTTAYLKESAAQVEILQAHHQAFQVQKHAGMSAEDIHGFAGPAMHALHNVIGYNSKPFFQDTSVQEFTHDNFEQLAPSSLEETRLEDASAADLHDNSANGNQSDASHISNVPNRVFIIESPDEGMHGVSCDLPQPDQQPSLGRVSSQTQESDIPGSQTACSNVSEEAPSMFYMKTLHEAKEAVHSFEKQTGIKYCVYKSTGGFGNTEYESNKPHRIYFEGISADLCGFEIPYDGVPFMIVGKKVMDCQYGVDRCVSAKRRYKESHLKDVYRQRRPLAQGRTKKIKCKAQIRMKEIIKYPNFKVSLEPTSKKEKDQLSRKLREALRNGTSMGEKRIYIQFPRLSDHKLHPSGENNIKAVKPRVSGRQGMEEVNTLSWDAFIQRFGNVIEHGQVVASAAWAKRPFINMRALHSAFCDFLDNLSQSGKEAVFRCYPSLPATSASEILYSGSEFQHIRLQTFSPEDALFAQLNTKYRNNFHFSFIICLQETKTGDVFTSLHERIHNARDIEILNALAEVKRVAWYRILDRVMTVKSTTA